MENTAADAVLFDLEEEKEKRLITNLTSISGGGGDKPWIMNLDKGDIFLVKENRINGQPLMNPPYVRTIFQLIDKSPEEKTYFLKSPVASNSLPVEPIEFCTYFRLHETLGTLYNPEEEQEGGDDERDRLPATPGDTHEGVGDDAGKQEEPSPVPDGGR